MAEIHVGIAIKVLLFSVRAWSPHTYAMEQHTVRVTLINGRVLTRDVPDAYKSTYSDVLGFALCYYSPVFPRIKYIDWLGPQFPDGAYPLFDRNQLEDRELELFYYWEPWEFDSLESAMQSWRGWHRRPKMASRTNQPEYIPLTAQEFSDLPAECALYMYLELAAEHQNLKQRLNNIAEAVSLHQTPVRNANVMSATE